MKEQKMKLKGIIPEEEFYTCIQNILNQNFYSASYYNEPFDIMPFQVYTLSKEHIEFIVSLFESRDDKILNPMYKFTKNNIEYAEYDLTDAGFSHINLLCGVIRDGIQSYILTPNEGFEYFKRILNLFIKFHKICIKNNVEYFANHKDDPKDISWKKTTLFDDVFYSDRYYNTLPAFASKYFSDENYRAEVEKIIDENIDMFTSYKFTYGTGLNSFNYLLDDWQRFYPFSYEFINKNYKYFYVPAIIKNRKCTESKEQLDLIFGKILDWNLSEIVRTSSFGGDIKPIELTKEKIDELILLFVAN